MSDDNQSQIRQSSLPASEDVDSAIGSALRSLREAQSLTARQLAEQSGISAAMISRIENAQVSPSIATMTALTNALDIPLVSLFRETSSERADFTHVRQGEGIVSTRLVGDHIHHYVNLALHRRRDMNFEAHLITVTQQSAAPPSYVEHGVIFMHVLKGSARYNYGKQQMVLEAGDSLSIDAELSHGINELLTDEFVFLSVQAECRR
ncbi:helix-turn-helix domain-containing protein [Granulosicoccus antarcticus]|uniref:HTH-type transcriptional repressor RghR n=1 Tax=Granulosicoccus antarcticus IMCC3135 TaxID=1192854 RepID=A0A2Z2P1P3_9GAMM|nr:helix-turn-helix transcriptional regulator [Granulosicoccus antarcticus]ASJ76148.1 HTH-type transcriptional repressor RghR [Granulosicoccus antarcticus IMCC3135]